MSLGLIHVGRHDVDAHGLQRLPGGLGVRRHERHDCVLSWILRRNEFERLLGLRQRAHTAADDETLQQIMKRCRR